MTEDDILYEHPDLEKADFLRCINMPQITTSPNDLVFELAGELQCGLDVFGLKLRVVVQDLALRDAAAKQPRISQTVTRVPWMTG